MQQNLRWKCIHSTNNHFSAFSVPCPFLSPRNRSRKPAELWSAGLTRRRVGRGGEERQSRKHNKLHLIFKGSKCDGGKKVERRRQGIPPEDGISAKTAGREGLAVGIIRGKVFQAEGTAIKREPAWRVPGAAKRPVWWKRLSQGEVSWSTGRGGHNNCGSEESWQCFDPERAMT